MPPSRRPRQLLDLTWPEIEAARDRGAGVILPVGSIEQHGPHLPLGTDVLIAEQLAAGVAEHADLLVAPGLAYAYRSRALTGGGARFPGTTSLTGQTFIAVVRDVLSEFLRQGFRRIALTNWHFENQGFLYEAAELAYQDAPEGARMVVFEKGRDQLSPETMETVFGDTFRGFDVEHGGAYETSIMMHLFEHLVLTDKIADDQAPRRVWYEIFPQPEEVVPASGVLTAAEGSSAEKGALMWGEIVAGLAAALDRDLPREDAA